MAGSRTELTRRELLLACLGAIALAVVMTWPLAADLGQTVPKDLADPLPQAWQVAWGGHALAEQPLEFFQSNQFWPLDDTLAFSDALIGYAPAGLIGSGPGDAIARYDVLFILSYALCFVGAYVLARELGLGPLGAAIAGVAFAFAPMRLEQDRHLHVISSGAIPLAFALALRGYRLRRARWVLAGFLVAAWQFSIGPTLGLPLAYLLALCGLVALVVWLRRARPALERRLVVATATGAAIFVAVAALIALPYLRVANAQADAERPPSTIEAFSGPLATLVLAPEENPVWGGLTGGIYDEVENPGEKTLFCGALIGLLALVGLWRGRLDRRLRIGLGVFVAGVAVLSLGFREGDGWLWPYRIAYDLLPGWDGMRTPGRLFTFATIGLALLAGAGAMALAALARRRLAAGAVAALGAAAVLAIAVEGRGLPFDPSGALAQPRAPVAPADVSDVPGPQLWLPAQLATDNRRYLLWSTDGFPDLVNGRSSVQPELTQSVIDGVAGFPDRDSVELLRELGVRSVVLDLRRAPGTEQARAARRTIAGLGLRRERRGDAVIYELGRGPQRRQRPGRDASRERPGRRRSRSSRR